MDSAAEQISKGTPVYIAAFLASSAHIAAAAEVESMDQGEQGAPPESKSEPQIAFSSVAEIQLLSSSALQVLPICPA